MVAHLLKLRSLNSSFGLTKHEYEELLELEDELNELEELLELEDELNELEDELELDDEELLELNGESTKVLGPIIGD